MTRHGRAILQRCAARVVPEYVDALQRNMNTARYANWLSGEAQTFVSAGSTPACATDRVVLSAAVCRTVVAKQAEWMTRGSIPSQPIGIRWCDSATALRTPARQACSAGWFNPSRPIHIPFVCRPMTSGVTTNHPHRVFNTCLAATQVEYHVPIARVRWGQACGEMCKEFRLLFQVMLLSLRTGVCRKTRSILF